MGEVFLAFDRLDAADGGPQGGARRVAHARRRRGASAGAAPRPLGRATRTSAASTTSRPSPWGPILVMEQIPGQTLHTHIREAQGPGRLHGGRVPQDRQRGLRRASPPSTPRASCTATSSRATSWSATSAPSSSTSASRRSARAPRRAAPARPPDGGTPELHVARSASAAAAPAPRTTSTPWRSRSGRCGPAASPSPATSRARKTDALRRSCSTSRRARRSTRSSRSSAG